ncbi:MAG: hypothetical protein ACOC7T_00765 [Planctomycetota bacterium]
MIPERTEKLVQQLDSFDESERGEAVRRLALALPGQAEREPKAEVNLHCHTFFSYNAFGWSPSRFAWEAAGYPLEAAGIVDFDVLDGVEEFLRAGRRFGLKSAAGFESRVFIPEYRDRVINSPHEPGIYYLAGTGFVGPPEPGTPAAATLQAMGECAQRRNRQKTARINEHLAPVTIDYDEDVLPLTPAGNATERHMLVAYERRAREVLEGEAALAQFWSEKLEEPLRYVEELLDDVVGLKKLIRSRLMKHGGVGYAPPEEGSFPSLDEVVRMTRECGAIPSGCWLDGTRAGEEDPLRHFSFLRDKGIPTLTVIPDRNWNVDDPKERALKVQKLHEALDAAAELEMPVLVGTEMNKAGQKFVDTFSAPALEPYRQRFLDAAHLVWGHTLLKSTSGVGYTGAWADEHFGEDRAARNGFFARVGARPHPDRESREALSELGNRAGPEEFLSALGP